MGLLSAPINDLSREHKTTLAKLEEIQSLVRGLTQEAAGEGLRIGEAQEKVRALSQDLNLHFRMEEEGLFPDVQRSVLRGGRRADVLSQFFGGEAEDDLVAHTVVRERIERVVQLLAAGAEAGRLEADSLAKARSLVEAAKGLLASHLAKEDKLVFPLIDRMLNPDELEAVKGRLQRILLTRDLTDGAQGLQPLGR